MKYLQSFAIVLSIFFLFSHLNAQRPEVTISLNEALVDSLLDAVYRDASPIEFSIASRGGVSTSALPPGASAFVSNGGTACKEVIQLVRENNGVRSAVRFRDGKILAPLAFMGNYSPPFLGCVPFSGFAETAIDLEFDQPNQKVVARARVLNVSLNGAGGVGGSLIAKMVQGSIDRKVNPIEIFRMEDLSFLLPLKNGKKLQMKAIGFRHDIENEIIRIHIAYDFPK